MSTRLGLSIFFGLCAFFSANVYCNKNPLKQDPINIYNSYKGRWWTAYSNVSSFSVKAVASIEPRTLKPLNVCVKENDENKLVIYLVNRTVNYLKETGLFSKVVSTCENTGESMVNLGVEDYDTKGISRRYYLVASGALTVESIHVPYFNVKEDNLPKSNPAFFITVNHDDRPALFLLTGRSKTISSISDISIFSDGSKPIAIHLSNFSNSIIWRLAARGMFD